MTVSCTKNTRLRVGLDALLTAFYSHATLLVPSKRYPRTQAMPTVVDPDSASVKGTRHQMSCVQVLGKDSSGKAILTLVSTLNHLPSIK